MRIVVNTFFDVILWFKTKQNLVVQLHCLVAVMCFKCGISYLNEIAPKMAKMPLKIKVRWQKRNSSGWLPWISWLLQSSVSLAEMRLSFNRTTSEWSSSSKGRRGERLIRFISYTLSVPTHRWPLMTFLLLLPTGSCSSRVPSSWTTWGRKLKWLSVKRWTFTTPTTR